MKGYKYIIRYCVYTCPIYIYHKTFTNMQSSSTIEFANEPLSNTSSPDLQNEDCAVLPVKLQRILYQVASLKTRMQEHRKEANYLSAEMGALERMIAKYATKVSRDNTKSTGEKRKRKPSGFASPTEVSEELCAFMDKPFGTLISRTETSRFLSKYISDHHLYNDENKSIIVPDEKLLRLLGAEASGAEITYFTIQKYINHHFVKNAKRDTSISLNA